MHLVQEQHRATPGGFACALRSLGRGTDVLHAGHHRRQRDELGIAGLSDQARQRGLAGAGRPPQNHRMQVTALEHATQRLARAEQMRLADEVIERSSAACDRPAVAHPGPTSRSATVTAVSPTPRRVVPSRRGRSRPAPDPRRCRCSSRSRHERPPSGRGASPLAPTRWRHPGRTAPRRSADSAIADRCP